MPLVQSKDALSPVAGDSGRWPKLKLDKPVFIQAWSETKATMVWAVPGYTDIWLAMMVDKDHEMAWFTDQIETAATDDKFLYICPEFFFKLVLDERLFVGCHEIGHAMYGHAGLFYMLQKQGWVQYADGVRLPFNYDMMNCAADYVINDQLIQAKIGKMPKGGLHWPMKDGKPFITGDTAVLDAYRMLWDEQKKQGKKPQQGRPCDQPGGSDQGKGNSESENDQTKPGQGGLSRNLQRTTDERGQDQGAGSGKSFDQVLRPGQGRGVSPNKAMAQRNDNEWNMAIQAAMESAKARGQLPANLERLFGKKLNPKANWQDLYQIAISKRIGNDRYTWNNLEPQMMYRGIGVPGRQAFGCDLVVIARDSSGSINGETCAVFGAETRAALEQIRPRRVIIVDCDAQVHRWEDIGDDLESLKDKVLGGGGTDFKPVFERIEAEGLEPDLLIYLTDCYGDYPSKKPNYHVVWGSVTPRDQLTLYGHDYTPPWGEVVFVPAQAEEK